MRGNTHSKRSGGPKAYYGKKGWDTERVNEGVFSRDCRKKRRAGLNTEPTYEFLRGGEASFLLSKTLSAIRVIMGMMYFKVRKKNRVKHFFFRPKYPII